MNGAADGTFSTRESSSGLMAIPPVLALPAVRGTIGRCREGGDTACTRRRPPVEAN